MAADLSYVGGSSLGHEEAFKITYAVADNGNGIGAFSLCSSVELITMK